MRAARLARRRPRHLPGRGLAVRDIHFISGLPRSGSTLLAAILRQNPFVHAGISSPVASLVLALQRAMSQDNEGAAFIDDVQRRAMLRGVIAGYYAETDPRVLIDTNRAWCAKLPLLRALFPSVRMVACVRQVPWILDSFERLVRANPLQPSRMFGFEPGGTVYSRAEALSAGDGLIGFAWNALREAFYGAADEGLMLLRYETLVGDPDAALAAVYDHLGLPWFAHDFADIQFRDPAVAAFDARLGMPGLHRVGRSVTPTLRDTILPPDLFARLKADSFWHDAAANPNAVRIV